MVHDSPMQIVAQDSYLGDILNSQGNNKPNFEQRTSKGLSIITQIENISETVSLGEHYYSKAIFLREIILINGMLNSAEIWYNLKASEIKDLESGDKLLL